MFSWKPVGNWDSMCRSCFIRETCRTCPPAQLSGRLIQKRQVWRRVKCSSVYGVKSCRWWLLHRRMGQFSYWNSCHTRLHKVYCRTRMSDIMLICRHSLSRTFKVFFFNNMPVMKKVHGVRLLCIIKVSSFLDGLPLCRSPVFLISKWLVTLSSELFAPYVGG